MPKSQTSSPNFLSGYAFADRFNVGTILGGGSTSTVYEAVETATGNSVALKVLHARLTADRTARARFEREATILRKLEGPHICPILDFGEAPDPNNDQINLLYLVLPILPGLSLDALLKQTPLLPLERIRAIVSEICAALALAHAQGVIHRDLKPANVMIGEVDDKVVVVDFGVGKILAKEVDASTGVTALTQTDSLFGTPEYMAPEQARGEILDERCDVYAAGIILYEMLTGHAPFENGTLIGILTAQLTQVVPPPREVSPERGISPALEAAVLHALTKQRHDRYPSAGALAEALERAHSSPDDVEQVHPDRFEAYPSRAVLTPPRPLSSQSEVSRAEREPVRPSSPSRSSIPPRASRPSRHSKPEGIPMQSAAAIVGLGIAVGIGIGILIRHFLH